MPGKKIENDTNLQLTVCDTLFATNFLSAIFYRYRFGVFLKLLSAIVKSLFFH